MDKQTRLQLLRALLIVTIIFVSYLFLRYTFSLLYPLLLTACVAFIMNPIVTICEQKMHISRTLATLLTLLIFMGSFMIGLVFLIAEVIQGTSYLAEILPTYLNSLHHTLNVMTEEYLLPIYRKLMSVLHTLNPEQQLTIKHYLQKVTEQLTTTGIHMLQQFSSNIPVIFKMVPTSFALIVFVMLASFFIVKDWPIYKRQIQKHFSLFRSASTLYVWEHLKRALSGFMRAQIILFSITSIIILIGLSVIGIEHAVTIALITTIIDLLPYIGTGLVFIPWILFQFFSANYPLTISLIVIYMIIVLTRQLIEPKLMSASIGVHPLLLLVVVFLGLKVWGMLGMLLAPLIVVIGTALWQAGVFKQLWLYIKG